VRELSARFDLPAGAEAPLVARHAVASTLRGWGFRDEDWVYAARIVVTELVNNAVIHGGGCLSLELIAHDSDITIAAADCSALVPRRREADGAGGRGLLLIEALSAQWGVHDHGGGKRVWARLPPYPQPSDV
jgi:anti-sigma regulatory factor (Ser/Thr protein kinase)